MKHRTLRQRVAASVFALLLCACLPFAAAAEPQDGQANTFRTAVAHLERNVSRENTTRAHYIQILYQAAGSPAVESLISFTDVSPDAVYATALVWAKDSGIARGDPKGAFRPDDLITEAERADFLSAALAALGETAQDLAAGMLSAYTGRIKTAEEWAISPSQLEHLLSRMEQQELAAIEAPVQQAGVAPPPDQS